MAIHNVIGDSFRGALWVSIHNGGGWLVGVKSTTLVAFGMVLDGSNDARKRKPKKHAFPMMLNHGYLAGSLGPK